LSKVNGRKERSKKRDLQVEIRALRREARKREDKVLGQIMSSRNVVLATCVGAASRLLRDVSFDLVVVDEAAQALEAACWIPLTHCREGGRVVLAGDHCQLPPTIKSKEAASKGLAVTLFERIIHHPTLHSCARLLDTQYRMHGLISGWASKEMYQDRLLAHSSNASHTLADMASTEMEGKREEGEEEEEDLSGVVMMMVDTAGCDMEEEGGGGDSGSAKTALSYRNTHEAAVVYKHVQQLYALGLTPEQIGVITPYNGQLECLRDLLYEKEEAGSDSKEGSATSESRKLEIRTVDGFQGGEKEAIIISLVRYLQHSTCFCVSVFNLFSGE
jgi:ATP-dependent RNA/DNA helicase IGHMBP2